MDEELINGGGSVFEFDDRENLATGQKVLGVIYKTTRGTLTTNYSVDKFDAQHSRCVLYSGVVNSDPTGVGIGGEYMRSLRDVLQAVADENQITVIHPILVRGDRQKRFFTKHGYRKDSGEYMDGDEWFVQVILPANIKAKSKLSPEETKFKNKLTELITLQQSVIDDAFN